MAMDSILPRIGCRKTARRSRSRQEMPGGVAEVTGGIEGLAHGWKVWLAPTPAACPYSCVAEPVYSRTQDHTPAHPKRGEIRTRPVNRLANGPPSARRNILKPLRGVRAGSTRLPPGRAARPGECGAQRAGNQGVRTPWLGSDVPCP